MGRVFVALLCLAGCCFVVFVLSQQDESAARCQGLFSFVFRWGEFVIAREVNGAAIIARDGRAQLREIGRLGVVLAFLTQLPMPGLPQGVDQPSLVTQCGERQRRAVGLAETRDEGRDAARYLAAMQREFGEEAGEVGREQPRIAVAEEAAMLLQYLDQQELARLR